MWQTSQRIVDVLLRALAQAVPKRIPARALGHDEQSDDRRDRSHTLEPFAYYEQSQAGWERGRPRTECRACTLT